jgi:YidC/Oxa1 family membrane protein insertase
MDDKQNYIIAIALSLIILIAWQYFYVVPQMEREEQLRERAAVEETLPATPRPDDAAIPSPDADRTGDGAADPTVAEAPATTVTTREQALARSPRVEIDTPSIRGSVALRGARIDDVVLKHYRETVEPTSPNIVFLSPSGSPDPFYAEVGWVAATNDVAVPDGDTEWTAPPGARLTPDEPLTLTWENGDGLVFHRTIEVDADYMFTVTDRVVNQSDAAVSLHPYGLVSRHGTPDVVGFFILHEGLIGVLGEHGLQEIGYGSIEDSGEERFRATGGWLGVTDKYWAAVLIPDQEGEYTGRFSSRRMADRPTYQTDFLLGATTVQPGSEASATSRIFAGAKEVDIVDGYDAAYGIDRFELLIDWGWFYFITKPLFHLIDWFFRLVGNFGVAILLTTVVIKLIFFPLANKSYVSMSRMKKVQPQMLEIRDRYKDDRMKQQQAMMELYKKEKINPLSGCLPIVVQIPVFFALYKVLFVSIEMRHAPFFGWIQDLSAPDPTSMFNLFGLIPWDPPTFLMIGIWPLLMGATMLLQFKLNPQPADPLQAKIMMLLPLMFIFLFATFPAGLVIYWTWNNILSIAQQWLIMKRMGVSV